MITKLDSKRNCKAIEVTNIHTNEVTNYSSVSPNPRSKIPSPSYPSPLCIATHCKGEKGGLGGGDRRGIGISPKSDFIP